MDWSSVNQLIVIGYTIFLLILLALTIGMALRWRAVRRQSNPPKTRLFGVITLLLTLFLAFELFARYIPLLVRLYL